MQKNNLKYLLLPWIKCLPNIDIRNMSLDSRTLQKKDVFIAIQGTRCHGNDFISAAIEKKVSAIISEINKREQHGQIKYIDNIPIIYFFRLSQNLSRISGRFYNYPEKKLKIIGVTGTNGKTTIIQLINQWHALFKKNIATIGTLGKGFYPKLISSNNTTPSSIDIQSFLYQTLKKKKK